MNEHSSASDSHVVSHDRVRVKLQSILRTAQANGFTDEELEGLSGVKARAIKSYRVEGKEPSLSAALSIMCALGGGGINPILSLIGYVARPLDQSDELQINSMVATGLQHFTTIAQAAADGRIDHSERPNCQQAADMIIATVLPLASAGQKQ